MKNKIYTIFIFIFLSFNRSQLLTVGGASAGVDICLNSKFQDQVVHCIS